MFHEDFSLSPAPTQGEHTEDIGFELGYDAQKIDELKGAGVVNSP
jgi:crotonobetainyl-CoA:carnitine CoA-transferase CaiB-like acyl-CoA transferase